MKKLALQELSRAKKMKLYNNFSTKSFDDKVRGRFAVFKFTLHKSTFSGAQITHSPLHV